MPSVRALVLLLKEKKIIDSNPKELKKSFKNKNLDSIFREITLNK